MKFSLKHTLVLNADGTPSGVHPLSSSINWQDAVTGVYLGNIQPLHFYENWKIRSPRLTVLVPSVVISQAPYIGQKRKVAHSKRTAFIRDEYTCQYCGTRNGAMTADHVKPKSKGGSSDLDNISTACRTCNNRKGDNASIVPKTMPHIPTYFELMKKMRKEPIRVPHESWIDYCGWDPALVQIVEPNGMPGYTPRNRGT